MLIDLDTSDLVCLVNGSTPNYDVMSNPLVKKAGTYIGGMADRWCWHGNLGSLQDEDLLELYLICKNSWIKK